METKVSIRFFNDREVRAVWYEDGGRWLFSVLDIVAVHRLVSRNFRTYPLSGIHRRAAPPCIYTNIDCGLRSSLLYGRSSSYILYLQTLIYKFVSFLSRRI